MPNDGKDNLIPANRRTEDELREMTKKGGIASGKARRKKANLRKALNTLLISSVSDEEIASELSSMGFDDSYEMAVMLSLIKSALDGDVSAVGQITKLSGANKDTYDIAEQRERTKLLKQQNAERSNETNNFPDISGLLAPISDDNITFTSKNDNDFSQG